VTSPPSWQDLLAEGLARQRAGELAAARRLYRRAAERSPDPAPARLLAVLLAEQGDLATALQWVRRALALDPKSAASHAAHGRVLSRQGSWSEAIVAFGAALAGDPALASAHLGRAHARLAVGDPAAACEGFDAALRLRPGSADARRAYAAALVACGNLDRAVAAVHRHPTAGEVRHALGQMLFGAGQFGQAAAVFAAAAALLPHDAAVRHDWGIALHEAGRPTEAIPVYQDTLACDPARAQTWHNLGSLQQALGDMTAAMAAYGRTYALDPASFPRIAQELAAGNPGRLWLRAEDLRHSLAALAGVEPSSRASGVTRSIS